MRTVFKCNLGSIMFKSLLISHELKRNKATDKEQIVFEHKEPNLGEIFVVSCIKPADTAGKSGYACSRK